ncbi:hypothetical protein ACS0TY_006501 [Phlomoides rotata]
MKRAYKKLFIMSDWNHLHCSEREITNEKRKAIEDMISSGMGAMDSFRYMTNDAGGEECVGHTSKDHLNCVNTINMEAIKGGDAQNMVHMLHAQSGEETDFFFRVRFNEDGRFCTVFWRDTMMMEDYDLFGDVVIFDTAYPGLLSSQRSESTNHSLGFNTNKSTTLSKFYEIFVVKVADWRKKEKNDEFQCSRKIPHPALPLAGLLEHAVKIPIILLQKEEVNGSKVAKDKAREYAKESGLDIVTVCPGLVVGPMLQHSTNARSLALIKLLRGIYYQIRVFL